jgi:hypothetical protein
MSKCMDQETAITQTKRWMYIFGLLTNLAISVQWSEASHYKTRSSLWIQPYNLGNINISISLITHHCTSTRAYRIISNHILDKRHNVYDVDECTSVHVAIGCVTHLQKKVPIQRTT